MGGGALTVIDALSEILPRGTLKVETTSHLKVDREIQAAVLPEFPLEVDEIRFTFRRPGRYPGLMRMVWFSNGKTVRELEVKNRVQGSPVILNVNGTENNGFVVNASVSYRTWHKELWIP